MRAEKLDLIEEKNSLGERQAQLEAEYREILEELESGLEIEVSGGEMIGS